MNSKEIDLIIKNLKVVGGSLKEITPQDASNILNSEQPNKKYYLVDVRSEAEFAEIHAKQAILIPLEKFNINSLIENGINKDDHVFVICRSGARSAAACNNVFAADESWSNLYNLKGGTNLWSLLSLETESLR